MSHKINNLRRKSEGFTIIEVLIVLAIAGLIMLIVFLAIPALQRNQRNNARNSEASRLSSAVTECLANKNGKTDACDTIDELGIEVEGTAPDTTLKGYQQFDSFTVTTSTLVASTTAGATSGLTDALLRFGVTCNPEGTQAQTGGTSRDFVVLYAREPLSASTTRCIGSEAN